MTNDKIAEIRARHEEGIRAGADEDRAYLLADVERLHKAHQAACEGGDLLRAELMQAIGLLEARLDTAIRERDEARAEVERLRNGLRQGFPIRYEPAAGCLCPAGANASCQNAFCPRRNPPGVTCGGGRP